MAEDDENKTSPLGLRVTPSLKQALEKAAKDEQRSVASMAAYILMTWLREKGYLEP